MHIMLRAKINGLSFLAIERHIPDIRVATLLLCGLAGPPT